MEQSTEVKWVVCDIETLSVRKNAVVPCIGMIKFDPTVDHTYDQLVQSGVYVKLDVDEQLKVGRHVMKDTVDWWAEQSKEAQATIVPGPNDVGILDFHSKLEQLGDIKDAFWFFRGPHFDAAILESLFEDFGIKQPWNFWAVRDTRTWMECHTGSTKPSMGIPEQFIAHDPVHDVARDAWMMLQVIHGHYKSA